MRKRSAALGAALLGIGAAASSYFLLNAPTRAASAPLNLGADGRYVTPVKINGDGPFDFIVDTGAQRSVIAPQLAAKLKLSSLPGANVIGTSGKSAGGVSILKEYSSGLFDRHGEMMVILPEGGVVSTGVMGMNPFLDQRLEVDFANHVVKSGPSGAAPAGFTIVPAKIVDNSFILVDAAIDGVHARAVIDTGARRTIGNSALEKALGISPGDPRLTPTEPVGGATADKKPAYKANFTSLAVGQMSFEKPALVFADSPVLTNLQIGHVPALVIGLDQIAKLKALAIDYPRSELQLNFR